MCVGCLLDKKAQQAKLEDVVKLAKKYAIENKKTMVIYFLVDGTPAYMEMEAARQAGERPIKYVSSLPEL